MLDAWEAREGEAARVYENEDEVVVELSVRQGFADDVRLALVGPQLRIWTDDGEVTVALPCPVSLSQAEAIKWTKGILTVLLPKGSQTDLLEEVVVRPEISTD